MTQDNGEGRTSTNNTTDMKVGVKPELGLAFWCKKTEEKRETERTGRSEDTRKDKSKHRSYHARFMQHRR